MVGPLLCRGTSLCLNRCGVGADAGLLCLRRLGCSLFRFSLLGFFLLLCFLLLGRFLLLSRCLLGLLLLGRSLLGFGLLFGFCGCGLLDLRVRIAVGEIPNVVKECRSIMSQYRSGFG